MTGRSDAMGLARWGGAAGLAGVVLMITTVGVVIGLGLPDASDPETLTDFADIETGRILEHLFYLGALILFALHSLALYHLLKAAHWAASLFGAALSVLGLAVMAASSVLHVSTSPLADLYTDPATPPEDLPAIEYAWHGAQSVFDTMLATGLLIAPIGMVLFGVAMRLAPSFDSRVAWLVVALGVIGIAGAVIEVVDRSLEVSALSVLAITAFHLVVGWRTMRLGTSGDMSDQEPDSAPATVG